MKSNPFYALSASAMLLGCFMLSRALELEAGKLRGLLVLILVLQLYELLLVGFGTFLVRSGRAPRDGLVVLAIGSVFLLNATGLSAECVTADRRVGAFVTLAIAALGVLKLGWVRLKVPELLSDRVAVLLGAHVAAILAIPVLTAELAAARALTPVVLYGLWWTTAALPLARAALRDATQAQTGASTRAHAVWASVPLVMVLWSLWSIGYIHTLEFHAAFLTPLLLGLALTLRPDRQVLRLALPALAVLMSLGAGSELHVAALGSEVSPLRLAMVAAGLVWLYLGWRDRDPWLAALSIGGAAAFLFGPQAARLARSIVRILSESLPRDRFGWGALTVIAAFVLLAAGARRSLQGEPRWPERFRTGREWRRNDARVGR